MVLFFLEERFNFYVNVFFNFVFCLDLPLLKMMQKVKYSMVSFFKMKN